MADRFDSLSRAMARGMSRRQAVKGLAAAMGGAVVAAALPASAGAVNCPRGLGFRKCGSSCCVPGTVCCQGKRVSRCCKPGQRCTGAGNCVPSSL
jgi:hypothetical protein